MKMINKPFAGDLKNRKWGSLLTVIIYTLYIKYNIIIIISHHATSLHNTAIFSENPILSGKLFYYCYMYFSGWKAFA